MKECRAGDRISKMDRFSQLLFNYALLYIEIPMMNLLAKFEIDLS